MTLHSRDKVEYGTSYQIFNIVISIVSILVFSKISYQVIQLLLYYPEKLEKLRINTTMLQIATIHWISIIFKNIFSILFLNNLIIPFPNSCTNLENASCFQCDFVGLLNEYIFSIRIMTGLLIIAIVLKINFQPFSSNQRHYAIKIKMLQIWVVLLLTTQCVLNTIYGNFEILALSDSDSKYVCIQTEIGSILLIIAILAFTTLISALVLFLYMSCKLLRKNSAQICKTKFARKLTYRKLQVIMNVIIKHTVIFTFIIIMVICTFFIPRLIGSNIDLVAIRNLCNGIPLFMLFRFGSLQYQTLFGGLHRLILNYWISKHEILVTTMQQSPTQSKSKSRSRSRSCSRSRSGSGSRKRHLSTGDLPTIPEVSENSKITSLDKPKTMTLSINASEIILE